MKKTLCIFFALALCLCSVSASADLADYTFGDVNNDNAVDNLDATKLLKFDVGLTDLWGLSKIVADVNTDGYIDNLDAALILKMDAGIIDSVGPTDYTLTEEKTNYALGKTYFREEGNYGVNYNTSPYLYHDTGLDIWADPDFTRLTDGVVGDITDEDYIKSPWGKPGVSVLLMGSGRTHQYVIDLEKYYGDINRVVFRNVVDNKAYGGNRGLVLCGAYVSDDSFYWSEITAKEVITPVEGAPEVVGNSGTGVVHFTHEYVFDEPAKGRFLMLKLLPDSGYNGFMVHFEEIEIWNK